MHITELIPQETLDREISEGRISVRVHPRLPLDVYNYTPVAQYNGHSDATKLCRGLVLDASREIVARPLPKFYNYGELAAPVFSEDEPVYVMDKADGSLIVAFMYEGQFVCCTRGSFESEQAQAAQKILDSTKFDWDNYTYLFEYVGPDNRIVLAYEKSELIFLGAVDTETGRHILPDDLVTPFRSTEVFPYRTFGEALAAEPRKNAEGFVVAGAPGIVKIKQEDYIRIHRLVSNLSEKSVWESLVAGKTLDEIKIGLPEEFHKFIDKVHNEIIDKVVEIMGEAYKEYLDALVECEILSEGGVARAEFARAVKDRPLKKYLFLILDGKPIYPVALAAAKPVKRTSTQE